MSGDEGSNHESDHQSGAEEQQKPEQKEEQAEQPQQDDKEKKPETITVHVGNLSFETTEESLKTKFSEFGNVISSRIPVRAQSGKSKGFGFIEYATQEEADKAIAEMNKKEFEGRTIVVDISRGRSERRSSERRGRRDDDYDRRSDRRDDRRRRDYDDYDRRSRRRDYDDYDDRRSRRRDYDDYDDYRGRGRDYDDRRRDSRY